MAAAPSGSDEDLYARSLHKSPSVRHYSYFSNKRVGLNKRGLAEFFFDYVKDN